MVAVEEIFALIRDETNFRGKFESDTDICAATGIVGMDVSILVESFAEKFDVDMSAFQYAYHYQGERFDCEFGSEFGYSYIPLTPRLLKEMAESGVWAIDYPPSSESAIWRWRPRRCFPWRWVVGLAVLFGLWMILA